jgi:HAD superfamily hydrolase (TIGR01509 family)
LSARAAGQTRDVPPAAILDIDGTLVDTNYQHTIAWFRAFRQHGFVLPMWQIHRHIGMGGDQLVASLTSEQVDEERGDDIRAAESALYLSLLPEVEPMKEARDLLMDLRERGHSIVLASSAKAKEVEHYVDLLDARDLADGWTTSDDVQATKPEPDLVAAAIEKAGGGKAVMVGDTTWDIKAAKKARVPTIAVMTGGFGRDELEDAGAAMVVDSVAELRRRFDATPFAD